MEKEIINCYESFSERKGLRRPIAEIMQLLTLS